MSVIPSLPGMATSNGFSQEAVGEETSDLDGPWSAGSRFVIVHLGIGT
jgi:hypothetical protein